MDGLKENKKKSSFDEGPSSSRKRKSIRSGSADTEEELKGVFGTKLFPGPKPLVYRQGQRFSLENDAVVPDALLEDNETGSDSRNAPNVLATPDHQQPQQSGKSDKPHRKSFDQTATRPEHEIVENKAEPQNANNVRGRRHSDPKKPENEKRNSLKNDSGNLEQGVERENAQNVRGRRYSDPKKVDIEKRRGMRNSSSPPSPPIEKHVHKVEHVKKLQPEPHAFFNVVKMAVSKHKHVTIIEERPIIKKRQINTAKALLVKKKKASKLALRTLSSKDAKNSSADNLANVGEDQENEESEEVGPQPAPYWVEMMSGKKSMFNRLKEVPDIGEALDHNPDLLTHIFKHPKFGDKMVQEPELAHNVIEHPQMFKTIAHKEAENSKGGRHHHYSGHPIFFLGHKYHKECIRVHPEDRATMIHRSQLSLARDQEVYDGGHSLKALMGVERVYLNHDEIIYEGFLVFCDRKMNRYFFQDVNGKIIYHIRDYQLFTHDCLRSFDYGVLDHEGQEVLRMKKRFSLTSKQRVDVYCPPNNFIGCVNQSYGIGTPSFWIKNREKHAFIEIRSCGRNWKSYCNKHDNKFEFIIKVVATQHDMGLISTMWFEKQMETYSFEPFYGIHWNDEMTLNVKGLLLSAMLLVYLSYYNGRMEKRLYVERYNTPARPSFSVCEEDLQG